MYVNEYAMFIMLVNSKSVLYIRMKLGSASAGFGGYSMNRYSHVANWAASNGVITSAGRPIVSGESAWGVLPFRGSMHFLVYEVVIH